ncbi:unnamed protein product [Peniophora sp. CBMAI 1063]|nr:unnamed protein product [Peniophora sp. CBMAI 1063]
MNPPPVGTRVWFLNAKGQQQRGIVHAHGAQPDNTRVVSVQVEGTSAIVTLPFTLSSRALLNRRLPRGAQATQYISIGPSERLPSACPGTADGTA